MKEFGPKKAESTFNIPLPYYHIWTYHPRFYSLITIYGKRLSRPSTRSSTGSGKQRSSTVTPLRTVTHCEPQPHHRYPP